MKHEEVLWHIARLREKDSTRFTYIDRDGQHVEVIIDDHNYDRCTTDML